MGDGQQEWYWEKTQQGKSLDEIILKTKKIIDDTKMISDSYMEIPENEKKKRTEVIVPAYDLIERLSVREDILGTILKKFLCDYDKLCDYIQDGMIPQRDYDLEKKNYQLQPLDFMKYFMEYYENLSLNPSFMKGPIEIIKKYISKEEILIDVKEEEQPDLIMFTPPYSAEDLKFNRIPYSLFQKIETNQIKSKKIKDLILEKEIIFTSEIYEPSHLEILYDALVGDKRSEEFILEALTPIVTHMEKGTQSFYKKLTKDKRSEEFILKILPEIRDPAYQYKAYRKFIENGMSEEFMQEVVPLITRNTSMYAKKDTYLLYEYLLSKGKSEDHLKKILSSMKSISSFRSNKEIYAYYDFLEKTEFNDKDIEKVFSFIEEGGKKGVLKWIINFNKRFKQSERNSIEEMIEATKIKTLLFIPARKIGSGGWSNVYGLIEMNLRTPPKPEDSIITEVIKIPFENEDEKAVKRVVKYFGGREDALKNMAKTEAEIAKKLSRRSILKFSENYHYLPLPMFKGTKNVSVEGESRTGLLYEYLDGKNLQQLIREKGPLRGYEFLRIGSKVAYALSFVHKNFGTHNDVKPNNFMMSSNCAFVYILDLAFSKLEEDMSSIKGVRAYTAPERILGGEAATEEADQYAFGVLLYELRTGKKPLDYDITKGNHDEFARKVHKGEMRPDFRILEKIADSRVTEIIKKCLAYNPEDRFTTMEEVENKLVGVADSLDWFYADNRWLDTEKMVENYKELKK